jgi:hypothetical protein
MKKLAARIMLVVLALVLITSALPVRAADTVLHEMAGDQMTPYPWDSNFRYLLPPVGVVRDAVRVVFEYSETDTTADNLHPFLFGIIGPRSDYLWTDGLQPLPESTPGRMVYDISGFDGTETIDVILVGFYPGDDQADTPDLFWENLIRVTFIGPAATTTVTTTTSNPPTGDNTNFTWLFVSGIALVVSVFSLTAVIFKKRNKA